MLTLSCCLSLLDKGYYIIIIVAISLLIILIPRLCGYNDSILNESPAHDAILSSECQLSYGILLVSTLPSVIDTTLDYANFFNERKWRKYIFGRVPLVLTGLLVSVQFFVIADTPSIFGLTSNRAASYLFSLSCLRLVFTGSMMLILTSIKPTVFTGRVTSLFTLFICFFIVIRTYLPGSGAAFHQFSADLNYVFVVVVVATLLYWLLKLAACTSAMTVSEYICLLYLLIYYVSLFGSYINIFYAWRRGEQEGDFTTNTPQGFVIMNYCFSFAFIMLSIAPGRIARFESVSHLVCVRCV